MVLPNLINNLKMRTSFGMLFYFSFSESGVTAKDGSGNDAQAKTEDSTVGSVSGAPNTTAGTDEQSKDSPSNGTLYMHKMGVLNQTIFM